MAKSTKLAAEEAKDCKQRVKRLCNTQSENESKEEEHCKSKKMENKSRQSEGNEQDKPRKGKSKSKKSNDRETDDQENTDKEKKPKEAKIQHKKARGGNMNETDATIKQDASNDYVGGKQGKKGKKHNDQRIKQKRAKELETQGHTTDEERSDNITPRQQEGNGVTHKGNTKLLKKGKEVDLAQMMEVAQMFTELKAVMEKNGSNLSAQEQILREVETGVTQPLKILGESQLIWKIPSFRSKYKMARLGEEGKTILYSPEFETHRNGYKVALSLCPNGDGQGKNEYMSIFFTILRGNYDGLQSWPFCHELTFTLIDQSEVEQKYHITTKFSPNPVRENGSFLGRPVNYRNPSLGIPRFVKLLEMWQGKYVKDDTIIIKVSVSPEHIIKV